MRTSSHLIGRLHCILILLASLAGTHLCRAGFITAWGRIGGGQAPGTNEVGSFRAISACTDRTLGLRSDGTLQIWGYTATGIETNTLVDLSNLTAIAAGSLWDLVLKSDGTLTAISTDKTVTSSNITAIAAGAYHWLAVKSDGTLIGMTTGDSNSTNPQSGLAGVTAVAAGCNFSLALKANGRVVGWGSNYFGEATVPAGLSNVVAIAAGFVHSLALKNDGRVVAWGDNSYGQCNVPAGLSNVVAIAAGYHYNLALKADGTMVGWGENLWGVLDIPGGLSRVVAIAAGDAHCVALTLQGPIDIEQNPTNQSIAIGSNAVFSVVATGQEPLSYQWFFGTNALVDGVGVSGVNSNTLSLIGVGDANEGLYRVVISNAFGAVTSSSASLTLLRPPAIIYQSPNRTVRAGADVTLQVSVSGTEPFGYQWSFNNGNIPWKTSSYLSLANVQPNASGIYSVLVTNLYGSAQADISLTVTDSPPYIVRQPYQLPNQSIVSNLIVSSGGTASWSVTARGSLPLSYQWRFNGVDIAGATNASLTLSNLTVGQTGFYNVVVRNPFGEVISAKVSLKVVQVLISGSGPATNVPPNLTNVIAVAAGNSHVLALKSDRSVVAWGGALAGLLSPTNVPASATNVIAIAANNDTSMALRGDGRVVVWGGGGSPALVTNVPVAASNIMAIACGNYHCLALNTNGTVIAWGGGSYGVTTVPPALSNNVVAVAAGQYHNLVLKPDGKVVAWGNNNYGQTNVPAGLSNVIAIAAGQTHSLALKSDGQVIAWGDNNYKAISVPSRLTNVVAIAAGSSISMALQSDGALWAWGNVTPVYPAGGNQYQYITNVIAMAASQGPQWPAFIAAVFGNGAPFFTLDPVTQNSNGGTVQLHARAVGVQPMRYQWQLDGVNIPGGTNGDLTITNFQGFNFGAYRVIASNRLGMATSREAWVKIPYAGNLSSALNVINVVWNWNTYSSTSQVAGVWFAQNRETHDGYAAAQSGRISDSQTTTLQTSITGPGTLTFCWKVSSEEGYDFLKVFVDGTTVPLAGISGEVDWQQETLALTNGVHTVRWIYSKDSSVSSGRDAGWLDEVVFVPAPPSIEQQPLGLSASYGDPVVMSVGASGGQPLSYQWMKNGTNLPGAFGQSLTLTNVSRRDSALYSARVSNSSGSVTSSNAMLRVRVPQRLTQPERLPGGAWRWACADANGGSPEQVDINAFEAQASTNLTDWIPLPGALTISNGSLLFQDSDTNTFRQRFYRVVER